MFTFFFSVKRRISEDDNFLVEIIEPEKYGDSCSESNSRSQQDDESEKSSESDTFVQKTSNLIIKTPNQLNESVAQQQHLKTYRKRPFQDMQDQHNKKPRKKFVPLRSTDGAETAKNNVKTLRIQSAVSQHPSQNNSQESNTILIEQFTALQEENKNLKSIMLKFTREAEMIQKFLKKSELTMQGWTETFKNFSGCEQQGDSSRETRSATSQSLQVESEPKQEIVVASQIEPVKPSTDRQAAPVPTSLVRIQQNQNKSLKVSQTTIDVSRTSPKSKSSAASKTVDRITRSSPQDTSHIDLPNTKEKTATSLNLPLRTLYILPQMPITTVNIFIKFEKDLRDSKYFEFVFDLLQRMHKGTIRTEKISRETFSNLLEQIIKGNLFKSFSWDGTGRNNRLRMVDFSFFMKLFSLLSMKLLGIKDDSNFKNVTQKVLRYHIFKANAKSTSYVPKKKNQKVVVLNYDLGLSKERESSESPPPTVSKPAITSSSINADPDKLVINTLMNNSNLLDEDLEKYFTTETVLEAVEDSNDDDVEDITPAPPSIDIADDSD